MIAVCSYSAGVCVISHASGDRELLDIYGGSPASADQLHHLVSHVDDWQEVSASDPGHLKELLLAEHRLTRALLNIETCIQHPLEDHAIDFLQEVEDLLQHGLSANRLLSHLLIAPVVESDAFRQLAKWSLARGWAVVAAIADNAASLQPQLHRLADSYLGIPEVEFSDYPGGRKGLWTDAVTKECILHILKSSGSTQFKQAWAALAFHTPSVAARSVIAKVGTRLADLFFPGPGALIPVSETEVASDLNEDHRDSNRIPTNWQQKRDQALKQVVAIVDAVAKGRDARANKFLDELVTSQLAESRGEEYVVKSLCNIGQRCAEMFRTDFERICLERARAISPNDRWTLIQFGDHLKRIGEYDSALAVLQQAKLLGEEVAQSAVASVYAAKGDYESAIAAYRAIPHGHNDSRIRHGIADCLRGAGRLYEARQEYDRIKQEGLSSFRTLAGIARIDRQEGKIDSAVASYGYIIQHAKGFEIDNEMLVRYRLTLASLLKQRGELNDALSIVDDILIANPFFMPAALLRATLLALLGKAHEAIALLPHAATPRAFGEWVQQYVRGLLLLLLARYSDARSELTRQLDEKILEEDSSAVLRLASAVTFLRQRHDIPAAKAMLSNISGISDSYTRYVYQVFRFHVAVAEGDRETQDAIEVQIRENVPNGPLQGAFQAIRARDWTTAWQREVESLLMLAAA